MKEHLFTRLTFIDHSPTTGMIVFEEVHKNDKNSD